MGLSIFFICLSSIFGSFSMKDLFVSFALKEFYNISELSHSFLISIMNIFPVFQFYVIL